MFRIGLRLIVEGQRRVDTCGNRGIAGNLCARHTIIGERVGSFYRNVTLLGTDIDTVREVAPRPAFLTTDDDDVVVFAESDEAGADHSGARLSAMLDCIAISVGIHDDDIFFFDVHDRGDSVISGAVPDLSAYFDVDPEVSAEPHASAGRGHEPSAVPDADAPPDAITLVGAVGRGDVDAVRAALQGDFLFATERHEATAIALGLPRGAVGWGYRYLSADATGYTGPALIRI